MNETQKLILESCGIYKTVRIQILCKLYDQLKINYDVSELVKHSRKDINSMIKEARIQLTTPSNQVEKFGFESEYIEFQILYKLPKTRVYVILNKKNRIRLGIIKWFAPWRQYSFFPEGQTVFTKGCMQDINSFIEIIQKDHKDGGD